MTVGRGTRELGRVPRALCALALSACAAARPAREPRADGTAADTAPSPRGAAGATAEPLEPPAKTPPTGAGGERAGGPAVQDAQVQPASVYFVSAPPLVRDGQLTVTVVPTPTSRRPRVVLGPDEFRVTADDSRPHTRSVSVGQTGEAQVVLVYRDRAGAVLAGDTLALPLRPRRRWAVTLGLLTAADGAAPHRWCRGCDGERRVPFRVPLHIPGVPPPGFAFLHVMWNADDPGALPKPPA